MTLEEHFCKSYIREILVYLTLKIHTHFIQSRELLQSLRSPL